MQNEIEFWSLATCNRSTYCAVLSVRKRYCFEEMCCIAHMHASISLLNLLKIMFCSNSVCPYSWNCFPQAQHLERLQAEMDVLKHQKDQIIAEREAQSLELDTIRADIETEQHVLAALRREESQSRLERYFLPQVLCYRRCLFWGYPCQAHDILAGSLEAIIYMPGFQ